ncbi:hypothetical protein D1872_317920 [compost metagenome]
MIHHGGEENPRDDQVDRQINADFALGREPFDEAEQGPNERQLFKQGAPGRHLLEDGNPGEIRFQNQNEGEENERLNIAQPDTI